MVYSVHTYNSGMPLVHVDKVVMKASIECPQAAVMERTQIALQDYMFYNNCIVMSEVIGSREEGYAVQWRRACYVGRDRLLLSSKTGDEEVANGAFDNNDAIF